MLTAQTVAKKGFVWLIGAGPGAADLITLRGFKALQGAEAVVYDELANADLLPLDYRPYPERIDGFLKELEQRAAAPFDAARAANGRFAAAAHRASLCVSVPSRLCD